MKAKIICMASAKGGSGKTVLTATFGTFLAALGKRVLLIDTDAATNGLTLLNLKEVMLQSELSFAESRIPRGVYERISYGEPLELVKLNSGVHILPATYSFMNTESVPFEDYKASLTAAIDLLKESYDYIFLDAQSGSDIFAQFAMSRYVSDEVVVVSEYDPMSAAGIERLKGLLREDLTYVRTWVLLNKMLPDFVQSFSDFLEVAKYLNPIPWDSDVVKAYARRRLALDLENGNEYTLAIVQTIKTLLGDDIAPELEQWVKERSAAIRQPLEDQYTDLEQQFKNSVWERIEFERQEVKTKYVGLLNISAIFITVLYILMRQLLGPEINLQSFESVVIFIVTFFAISASAFYVREVLIKRKKPMLEIELARIRRRESVLEEKLRKLEILKTADLETLMKSKKEKSSVE